MNMLTALQRSGGIDALARQADVATSQAMSMTRDVLPTMLAAFRGLGGGRAALLALFERNGGAGLAALIMGVDPVDSSPGRAILAGLPGAESAGLSELAARSGQDGARLLPLLVMLVAGYMSAMAAGHGGGPQGFDELLAGDL